jgi:hypothetical protein
MELRHRQEDASGSPVEFITRRQRAALAAAVVLVSSACAGGAALAATCTSTGTGNWNAKTTWGTAANGCVGATGGIPGAADAVNIANLNHTVTVSDNRSAGSITFTAGGNYSNLTLASAVTLNVTNAMTVNGATGGAGTRRVTVGVNAVLNVGGDLIMNGGSSNTRDTELLLNDGPATAVNVTGDFGATTGGGNFNSAVRMLITFNGNGTLSVGNNFGGGATLASGTGTIVFNGAGAQSIPSYSAAGSDYYNITINKSVGTATLAGNILVRGDFSNSATARFSAGNCTTQIRTVTFQGTTAQNLTGAATATSFCRVTVNNANNLVLAHDLAIVNTANGLLTLTTGNIVTGANEVSIGNGSNIASAGANDFVIGNLTKAFTTGANVSRTFEAGTATGGDKYAPVTLVFASVSTGGNVTVSTVGTEHPDVGSSDLNAALDVNRYWTIANGGVAFTTYSATFTFVNPGDLDSGVDPLVFIAEHRSPPFPAAGSWNATTIGTRTATTNQITGETNFGDFAIGTRTGVTPGIGRFNAYDVATPGGQVTGVIQTKVAGTSFNVNLVAVNAAGNAIQTGFTGAVVVELLNASDDSGTLDADACRPSWPVIQTLSPNPAFAAADNGRITVSFTENNAWPVARIRISNTAGTRIGCSTDAFAIRPSALANLTISHGDWQTPGATALNNTAFTAGELHKAGRSFRVVANAVNGAGSPAITTNYTGSPTATLTACGGAACTSSFGSFTLGGSFVAGQLASDSATYSEVGAFNLRLMDSTFADIDSADGTPTDCSGRYVCSGTIAVGRFVPDHFAVSVTTAPAFGTGCGAGGFTYVGQSFGYTLQPVVTVTAQSFNSNPTTLYAGNWWRISNTDLTPATQAARYSAAPGTLDLSGLPAVAADPVIVPGSPAAGQGTLTFSSGTGLRFTRTSPTAPASPYNADIGIAINVADADGVVYASNPMNVGLATAGNGINFNNGKQMRFGRLYATSARGSALVPLSLRLELQYWNGTAFVTNTADTCTTISANNIEMTNFSQNLDLCETSLTVDAFAKGRATARLSKPGGANTGSVTLVPRLGSSVVGAQTCIAGSVTAVTGANLPYLQGKWDATDQLGDGMVYDDNPAARGTFGVYPGSGGVIDLRENF